MFSKLLKHLCAIFFPLQCLQCGKEDCWLCTDCLNNLHFRFRQVCPVCKRRVTELGSLCGSCQGESNLDGILIACEEHEEVLRKLIHKFKYNFYGEISQTLGSILLKSFLDNFQSTEDLVLVPIPLHPRRERWRGFNQSVLLASFLGSYGNLLVLKNLLVRNRYTKPQMKLKRSARLQNLQAAFAALQEVSAEKTYVLVDDVVTTGSTLEACAEALRQAGARRVWGLALSRGT